MKAVLKNGKKEKLKNADASIRQKFFLGLEFCQSRSIHSDKNGQVQEKKEIMASGRLLNSGIWAFI